MGLGELADLASVRIYIPKDLRPPDARALALKARCPPDCVQPDSSAG